MPLELNVDTGARGGGGAGVRQPPMSLVILLSNLHMRRSRALVIAVASRVVERGAKQRRSVSANICIRAYTCSSPRL